ncbi:hypothetical protein BX659_10240 [Orenia metallireducens]|jgi:hypothetical protein|uniref:Uncharacterized protein n=1 Tax=Orenia metallireducens TaxID=1413210 RepID=A0A285F226_9FIRM|nr:hypothetical protein [Orenia metallireducens]PRX34725.1 hypothetical protein BX659_10240 [Orenia metallireducens]SNY05359.1 hypothetical protein SAMN06265827_10140 [Orenia metallireducens]
MAQGPKEKHYNHEASDNPEGAGNDFVHAKNILEQELGSTQEPEDIPKGYVGTHSMPALFGWISQEYQRQIADDLVEMGKSIEPKTKKK